MKILITGASGYVGSKIYNVLKNKAYDVIGSYNNHKFQGNALQIDLTNEFEVEKKLKMIRPNVIIHLAADAHSKTCEENPKYAKRINVDSTKYLVNLSKNMSIRLIYLSSFACFNPTNVYGKTKLKAEKLVSTLENYVIIRSSLIVGLSPNTISENFFNSFLHDIKNKEQIEADTSWEFELTCLNHLVQIIEECINNLKINKIILPVVSDGVTSRYTILKDLTKNSKIKLAPIDQNRKIDLPVFDKDILSKYGLPNSTYEECIKNVRQDINHLLVS